MRPLLVLLVCAAHIGAQSPTRYPTVGTIERFDPAFDAIVSKEARIEKLAAGFAWAEGPAWRRKDTSLVFSDVPRNTIYQWRERTGLTVFLRPSGFASPNAPGRELGSNGLTVDKSGAIVMADHGNRMIARLEESTFTKTTLAARYQGKRFNSPNDLVYRSNGDLFFTDPPFGLRGLNSDPAKELKDNGVYRLTPSGALTLLTRELVYPNGIAFSPDERTLYVSNADSTRPILMAYDVAADGALSRGRLFFDASRFVSQGRQGVPDGMRVDRAGNVFTTGPGGVYVLSPAGKLLGAFNMKQPTANCAFGDDGSTLYITSNDQLVRVRLKTKGIGF